MSLFNEKKENTNTTVNNAWSKAYKITKQEELLRLVVSSFLNDSFYEKGESKLERIKELVKFLAEEDPVFLLGLAVKTRTEYHMRSTSHVLIAEIQKYLKGDKYKIKEFIFDSIERVDDMTEISAYLLPKGKSNKKERAWNISHSLVKAYKSLLWYKKQNKVVKGKFDEYQLAKYNRKGKSINLKDIVRLSHSNSDLAIKILNDELKTPFTWEVEISKLKNNRLKVWDKLISENKIWYMALLRNLRNIIVDLSLSKEYSEKEKDEFFSKIVKKITDKKSVEKSKLLPFRFYSAWTTVKNLDSLYTSTLIESIEKAATYAVENMKIEGTNAIFSDVSGSMEFSRISSNSSLRLVDLALLFGGMVKVANKKSVTWIFGNVAKLKNISWNNVFDLLKEYKEGEVWYSTYGYKIFELLKEKNIKVDNVFIMTDLELYSEYSSNEINESIKDYQNYVWKEIKVFIFNLSTSHTDVSKRNNVYTISWWSDKIFEYINILEDLNKNTIIDEIKEKGKKYLK